MQALVERFVPAADEVSRLQRGDDAECRFFQSFAEDGHYGGRSVPTGTRQGIYAVAPSGRLLASINTRSPLRMVDMLERALRAWQAMPAAERELDAYRAAQLRAVRRARDRFPEDGLVLEVLARDLPRGEAANETESAHWHAAAWNRDWAWFTAEEVRRWLGEELVPGEGRALPEDLALRLARLHCVDHVRGQVKPWRVEEVRQAEFVARVERVRKGVAELRLEGAVRAEASGHWPVRGHRDREAPLAQSRGIDLRFAGVASYDQQQQRFVALQLIGEGTRHGGTQYNSRGGDLETAPIGLVLRWTPEPARVAPAFFWKYGWR